MRNDDDLDPRDKILAEKMDRVFKQLYLGQNIKLVSEIIKDNDEKKISYKIMTLTEKCCLCDEFSESYIAAILRNGDIFLKSSESFNYESKDAAKKQVFICICYCCVEKKAINDIPAQRAIIESENVSEYLINVWRIAVSKRLGVQLI